MARLVAAALLLTCALPLAARSPDRSETCAVIPLAGDESPVAVRDAMSPMQPRSMALRSTQRVARYDIDASLDPATHTVNGNERVEWRNRSDAIVCTLYLHLDLNAYESHGTRYMAVQRARGSEPGVRPGDFGYSQLTRVRQNGLDAVWMHAQPVSGPANDHSLVRIDLPQPVGPGDVAMLDIGFVDQLPGAWAEAGHAGDFHLAAGWFPQIATLALPGEYGAASLQWNAPAFTGRDATREPSDFDVRLDLPRDYAVATSGESRGLPLLRGDRRSHRFTLKNAGTFAWAADSRFAQPLEYRYFPLAGPPMTLRVLYRPGHAAAAVAALGMIADALAYHAAALGPYPATTLTAVVTPRNAQQLTGQVFPGLFTVTTLAAKGDEAGPLDRTVLAAIGSAYFSSGPDDVFDAGLQRYWADRFQRARGQATAQSRSKSALSGLLAALRDAFVMQAANHAAQLDDSDERANHIAWALHDLEMRIGAPAMNDAFRGYLRSVRAGHPDAEQLRWAMADASGHADEFQRAFAIIGSGIGVADRIAHFSSEEVLPQAGYAVRGGKRVELGQAELKRDIRDQRRQWRQRRARAGTGPFPYRTVVTVQRSGIAVPQALTVTFADGSTRVAQWDDPRTLVRFEWTTPAPAVSAQLDPQRLVQLDRNRLDDGRTLAANLQPVRRWTGDLAALMQMLASWVALL